MHLQSYSIDRALACLFFAVVLLTPAYSEGSPLAKPRVIATTDGEVDDRCSMVRFLLYTNEWDVLGIIHSSSKFHWAGDDAHKAHDWKPVEWLDEQLDAYAKVYPNLKLHDPGYPTPDHLRAQVFTGNIAYEGDIAKATPGSDRIVEVLLGADESPVWLQAWGGANTIARALKTIQEDHPDRVAEVSKKARVFLIAQQDNTYATYIKPAWPDLEVILSDWSSFGAIAYNWKDILKADQLPYFDKDWMTANILEGHGPLCALYEAKDGRFRSEGDSPSFLHVINTGLRSAERPSNGGWGGRFGLKDGLWKSKDKKGAAVHSVGRWAIDFQNDWAARADWCVAEVSDANHPPKVVLSHDNNFKLHPGDTLELDAGQSTDRDGDSLAYRWWHDTLAGRYTNPIAIDDADAARTSVLIPNDAKPDDTIHFVCSVTDAGTPPLTRYARVIVRVATK